MFQLTNRYKYQFIDKVMTDIVSMKEIIESAILGIPKGTKKNAISIPIAFGIDILIRNENIISEKYRTKDRLK